MHIFQIPNGRLLEHSFKTFYVQWTGFGVWDLGINFDTFELGDSEQPGNSEPLFDDKFAYLLTIVMK